MSNLIQIKRSATASVPGSLANGELAFTSNGNVLYIGSPNGSIIGIGGLRVPGTLTANQALVANSTSGINEIRAGVANVGAIYANGNLGTNGQVLTSNGTGVHWSSVVASNGTVTSVTSGNGLTGGPITTTGTLSVQAADGIVANSGGVFVQAGTGVTVNSTGVHIGQAVGTGSSVTFANVVTSNLTVSASVSSNLMPSSNNTFHIGNTTIKWAQVHAANVHGVTGIFDGNVEVAGDLIVAGNVVTTNVSSIIVSDAKILLAANNPGDILDIGFSGTYTDGGSTVRHAGLFRDASDNGVFKFFANTTQDLTGNNVIDIGATGYTTAILETFLKSGALSTNSTVVSITANSTVNVAIVANTLTLTTGLAGTSGGTGLTTIANNAILVGNTTNGYNTLALGTTGHVLQSNGTALIYNSLDGGTF